ncbi:MAG: GNAT family N-acetyltransferase [Victivallales bacterium]|nr:GNAT family N-acetyltransferase [Victivallales bacterium]
MIRRATQEDIPAILRLLEQVLAVHHQGRPDLFREKGTKYSGPELAQMLGQADAPIFVLEEGGSVAGYLIGQIIRADGAAQEPITTLYVDDLCVDESARGKGIGRQLMEYARDYAREQGCHNLTLHVWEGNPGAQAFYESLGMKTQYTCLEWVF